MTFVVTFYTLIILFHMQLFLFIIFQGTRLCVFHASLHETLLFLISFIKFHCFQINFIVICADVHAIVKALNFIFFFNFSRIMGSLINTKFSILS